MKLAVHSDLHLEGNIRLPKSFCSDNSFDLLVLAGDITSSLNKHRLTLIRDAVGNKPIIYVPGNHEYYRGLRIPAEDDEFRAVCNDLDIRFMNREVYVRDGVVFVCATGWADLNSYPQFDMEDKVSEVRSGIRDFSVIMNHQVEDMIERSKVDREFICSSISKYKELGYKVVVVTHFAPTEEHNSEHYDPNLLSAYFANDWADIMYEFEPDIWIYGHTHGSVESRVYRTRVICNQRGYGIECAGTYNPNKIVSV